MFSRLKRFFGRENSTVESYLKKLSVNRHDLIRTVSDVDIDSPVSAYITLAILLKEKGEYYKSLKILESLDSNNLTPQEKRLLYLNLALVYRSAGFLDRAEEALRKGIEEFPSESFFYYELAQIKRISGKLEEAVELLERAVELKEEFLDDLIYTKLYLADSYINEGRTDKAFRILRKLHLKFPIPLFYYVLSKLYYSVGEIEKGFKNAILGMRLSPEHSAPFLQVIEENEGITLEKLKEITSTAGLTLPAGKRLVEELIKEGMKDEAIELLEELLSKYFSYAYFQETYLKLLWETGKRKKVAQTIEKFLEDLKKKQKAYKCRNCGYRTDTFNWMCPRCKSWETLEINCEP